MSESTVNNKRIAKNSVMLYIRMLFSIAISLYTSRVVLNALGVEDFGIYGVVGGIVSMFSFLNASMAGATSRFMTYEIGLGNNQRLSEVFSSALIIHIGIALVVFVLSETVGLWFLCNKLDIPEGRMNAAHWVYQLSVVGIIFNITQVPYNSLILSHERMDIYAYIEILNVILKLLIVYLLSIFDFDKLKLYSILMLLVSIIVMAIYRIYCICNFKESHFRFLLKRDIMQPMLSFSGWNFYSNMCVAMRQHGSNFIINIFFGVILNAASSIATAINSILTGFAYNIIAAFRPRIIKSYSIKQWSEMQNLTNNAIIISSLLFIMIIIPCYLEIPFLIQIWLGTIPDYAPVFIRITFISNCFSIIASVFNIGVQATGNVKLLSLLSGSAFLITLPISYLLLKSGFNVETIYVVNTISVIVVFIINIFLFHKYLKSINMGQILFSIVKILLIALGTFIVVDLLFRGVQYDFLRLILRTLMSVLCIGSLAYFIVLTQCQRRIITEYLVLKISSKLSK